MCDIDQFVKREVPIISKKVSRMSKPLAEITGNEIYESEEETSAPMDQAKINTYTSQPRLGRQQFADFVKSFQSIKYSNLNDLNSNIIKVPDSFGDYAKDEAAKKAIVPLKKGQKRPALEIVYKPNQYLDEVSRDKRNKLAKL
jgi:hypothetical protein